MLGQSPLALAALGGQMVVDAAATDGWKTAECGYAKLLGRGDAKQTKLVKQWLEETREQLADGAGADMELIRAALAGRWAGRLADLLEENPSAEAELRVVVEEIQATLPAERLSVSNHTAAANGDMSTYAAGPEHLPTRSAASRPPASPAHTQRPAGSCPLPSCR